MTHQTFKRCPLPQDGNQATVRKFTANLNSKCRILFFFPTQFGMNVERALEITSHRVKEEEWVVDGLLTEEGMSPVTPAGPRESCSNLLRVAVRDTWWVSEGKRVTGRRRADEWGETLENACWSVLIIQKKIGPLEPPTTAQILKNIVINMS